MKNTVQFLLATYDEDLYSAYFSFFSMFIYELRIFGPLQRRFPPAQMEDLYILIRKLTAST